MCGIVGFNWDDKQLVKKMADSISHRGPDGEGYYTDKGISLGHRRLSIIDLSNNGKQPMENEDGNIIVVFNGEIYNYKKLKADLELKKHKFSSKSDTEVIVHGYEEYGEKVFSMLEGMFAIAIWDVKKKKLILARDRIGEKPLYYYYKDNKIIFASEIKAILEYEEVKREIDKECLTQYLSLRFSPQGKTMFKEVRKVMPGSFLVFDGKLSFREYWNMPKFEGNEIPSVKRVDELISEAIEERLMADVPLGVFLSGGLDSSAIVAYMSKFKEKIDTFSIGFGHSSDETKYAKIIADKFGTNHHELIADQDILKNLPKIVWHLDEPLADPANLPMYVLSEKVSKSVKVALSGEGGDETFGGYDTFNSIPLIEKINKMPFALRKLAAPEIKLLSKLFKYPKKQMLLLLGEILQKQNKNEAYKLLFYLPFNKEEKILLLNNAKKYSDFLDDNLKEDLRNGSMQYYFKEYLPNDLLMKADKMSMAHGLEVRPPFLDLDLVDYFSKVDNNYKFKRKIFRETIKDKIPDVIMKKKKQGFTLPLSDWFKSKDFNSRFSQHFEDLKNRKIFNEEYYNKIVSNPTEFRNDHRLWLLLNFELWNKIYVDGIEHEKISS